MKKILFYLFILFALTINANAQIPNNGFENWITIGNCMKPTGWYCTNDFMDTTGSYFGVTRSNDHYPATEGSYSIKIENNTSLIPNWGSMGLAWTGDVAGSDNPAFPISGHPTSFCGYYKFLPQNKDTMRIFLCLYKNGNEVTQAKLTDTVTASAWTSFIIPVPSYTDADSARIFLSSFNSDGAMAVQGNSVLYVDNLSFNSLIGSVSEQNAKSTLFNLYPNPAADEVTLNIVNTDNAELTFNIYNVMGKLIRSETIQQNQKQINVSDLISGIYLVVFKSKNLVENQRLIIQR
jgi:hypothetical protein